MINLTISLFSILKVRALECLLIKKVVNQKCMPRPKILDVNEGVGEALFYLYNVLVNKCSGSYNTFDNPMAKLWVPNVIKRVNMQVYNFLMRLNETRNVLWHESCKCICKLNSSVCNNKQIWNDDACRCDCNEDFAGVVGCDKGYTWNPSTCECQCDMWCKPGQYLDHKNCICKNKLIGRLIEECTSVINDTMINNKDSGNNNTLQNVFIGLFSVAILIGIICFCVFAYFKWFKSKKLFKKNILIIEHIKMDIKLLEIKNKINYNWDDIVYINDFNVNSLEIIKRESRIGASIYYIGYVLNPDYDYNTMIPLYFVINRLIGYIEEIEGSSDKYLVVSKNVRNKNINSVLDTIWGSIENKIEDIINPNIKIKDYDKFRFNSDIDLLLDTTIEFRSLAINVSCVIEKDNEYYPEIYLNECLYVKSNIWPMKTLFSKKYQYNIK